MEIHKDSHVDHGLSREQIEYLLRLFSLSDGFFIETVELPEELGRVPCSLHGPLCGDEPVKEEEVTYACRKGRSYKSRLCARETRATRLVTVVAGPHDGKSCVVYTMFGGLLAPQEPSDPTCKDVEGSKKFWADHALSCHIM